MTNEHALVVIGCYVPLVNSVANEAWQTLRSAVLAQQPTNIQSTPSCDCGRKMVSAWACPVCDSLDVSHE